MLGVDVFAFVAEDGVAGFYFQLGNVGEAGDEGFGEAVAEEVGVGAAAGAGEGDNGEGSDLIGAGFSAGVPDTDGEGCDQDDGYGCDPIGAGRWLRGGRLGGAGFSRVEL